METNPRTGAARRKRALAMVLDGPVHALEATNAQHRHHSGHFPAAVIARDQIAPPFERLFVRYFRNLERAFPRTRLLELLRARERTLSPSRKRDDNSIMDDVNRLLLEWLREQVPIITGEVAAALFLAALRTFCEHLRYWGDRCGVEVAVRPEDEERLLRWAEEHSEGLVDQVNTTTRKIVVRLVRESLDAGKSPRQILEEVRDFLADKERTRRRARTIARTESWRAANFAAHDVMRLLGAKWKSWKTNPDCETCPICLGNEAEKQIPMDQLFASGQAAPPAHPNCCCNLVYSKIDKACLVPLAK